MSTVVTGYHWDETNPEEITGAKLNATGSGTVTGITQSDLGTGVSLITIGTSPPTPSTGLAWFDTTQGAGRGLFKLYDNGRWTTVSQGFLGWNNGTTLARGNLVSYDTSLTPATVGTVPVHKTSIPTAGAVQFERPVGVAAEQIVNGGTGIILTYGYATCRKDAVAVTAGDAMAASLTGVGQGTSDSLGSWGPAGGSASFGRWLDTSAAAADTEVSCFIYGATPASWTVFKNSGGTVLANAAVPVLNAWTATPSAPSTAPIGTIAHICQFFVTSTTVAATPWIFGLRMTNSTVDVGTGAAHMRGCVVGAAVPLAYNAFGGQLKVFETTAASSNTMQYFLNSSAAAGTFAMTINEIGVIVGGQIA